MKYSGTRTLVTGGSGFIASHLCERLLRNAHSLLFKPLPTDDPKQRQPDITLAREKLNWTPEIELHDGLERTIEYFKSAA